MLALVSRCRNRASSHLAMGFREAGTDLMALADKPMGVASAAFTGHLIGLATIAKTVRAAALRCDSIRPYLPPSPTAL